MFLLAVILETLKIVQISIIWSHWGTNSMVFFITRALSVSIYFSGSKGALADN